MKDRRIKERRINGPDRRGFKYSKYIPEHRMNNRRIIGGNRRR